MEIKNAILHIIKNDGSPSIYSETELDIDSEVCEVFISKHVKKLTNNPATREATFNVDSVVYHALKSYMERATSFKDLALQLGARLSEIIANQQDIPPSDLLIVRFDLKQDQFLAIIKLNYNECYSHEAGESANNIIKCNALPFGSGKVDEACLIPFNPMVIKLIEKPHSINGEMVNYFSEIFLESDASLSRKETAQIISEVSEEFVQEHFESDIKTSALLKTAMAEEAEEADGIVSMENVAQRAFTDDTIKNNYIHTMREAGIIEDMPLGAKFVKQQFGTQRLKAENGIEIKFPADLAVDEEQMEINQHPDGSVTLTLKRLRLQV